jgi:hypothetical protein
VPRTHPEHRHELRPRVLNRGSKSPGDFEHDGAQCLQENSTKTAARYWRQPPHRLEWVRAVHGRQGLFETVTTGVPDSTKSMCEIGSVVESVVRLAHCPVLTIPAVGSEVEATDAAAITPLPVHRCSVRLSHGGVDLRAVPHAYPG